MRRSSLALILLVSLASLFLLSILSNVLTGYPESSRPLETPEKRAVVDIEEEPSVLLFKVSPVTPKLYWRTMSADYYTGQNWIRTTEETILEEFPPFQNANATRVFTVDFNSTQRENFLPLPSPNSTLANISLAPIEGLRFYIDTVGNVYKLIKQEPAKETPFTYNVSWYDIEINDHLISLDNVPEEILNKYLQLPDISIDVWKLSKDLEDSSYSILDQVLADIQFLRTNFVYDLERSQYLYERIPQGSDVTSYIQRRKGVCIDAATALAVILRIQEIPARISIGFKPERIEGGKLLYFNTGAHAVTEIYLPPYGWIQFDATPPLEETPLVKVFPFKKESAPGSKLFYQISITNRRNMTDDFKLLIDNKQEWNIKAAPRELRIEAFQTADALLEVTIPDDADLGEKDVATITVASLNNPEIAFSIIAIIQVEDILHIYTKTTLGNIDEAVIRGDTFWVNGTVLTASDEQVDNMTIFIFLTKRRETEGIIVGKGNSTQGNFQIESTVPLFMEIGDYKVIFISLGTTQYAPFSNNSTIRVRATTRTEFGSEEEFLQGYGAIHGRLLWDNGTGVANASISLKITSLDTSSEVWKSQNLTFNDGSFRVETAFLNPETYELEAMFTGDEYVIGSSATLVVKVKRGQPTIQILGEDAAVRGEVFNITGTVQFEEIGVWGEHVTVAFDNQLLVTIKTGDNGFYTWSFLVDSEEKLGPHFFKVSLKKGDVSAVHTVVVKSKATLTARVSNIARGMFLLFSAHLSDDHDLPIQGAEIVIDNYGLSWKTDKNGNLTILLDAVKLWPENLVLRTRFGGSELYLPDTTEKEVAIEPIISLPFLIPLVFPTLVVMVFAYVKHHIERRRQALRQISDFEVAKERAVGKEEIIYGPQELQPLKIILPDIEAQFPYVWGVNEKLRIGIVLDTSASEKEQKRDVEVLVNEETVASVRLSQQGRAELSHAFTKKGEHRVRAILPRTSGRPSWNAEIKLRVVDYGEEIIRLYNEFLLQLAGYGIHARKEMTVREIESIILSAGDFDPEALRKVTFCFEKAEYSNHSVTRKDYEIMYLSLRELNIDVEHKD